MNSLIRRVDKLEVEHTPSPEELYRVEKLRTAIAAARGRIKRLHPGHQFSASLPSGGKFGLGDALERGRQWAKERIERLYNR